MRRGGRRGCRSSARRAASPAASCAPRGSAPAPRRGGRAGGAGAGAGGASGARQGGGPRVRGGGGGRRGRRRDAFRLIEDAVEEGLPHRLALDVAEREERPPRRRPSGGRRRLHRVQQRLGAGRRRRTLVRAYVQARRAASGTCSPRAHRVVGRRRRRPWRRRRAVGDRQLRRRREVGAHGVGCARTASLHLGELRRLRWSISASFSPSQRRCISDPPRRRCLLRAALQRAATALPVITSPTFGATTRTARAAARRRDAGRRGLAPCRPVRPPRRLILGPASFARAPSWESTDAIEPPLSRSPWARRVVVVHGAVEVFAHFCPGDRWATRACGCCEAGRRGVNPPPRPRRARASGRIRGLGRIGRV